MVEASVFGVQVVTDALVRQLLAYEGKYICRTEFGKALGGGLYELRVRQSPQTIFRRLGMQLPDQLGNPTSELLIRVFFAQEGNQLILLLGGMDKGRVGGGTGQALQIAKARKVLEQYRREQRRPQKPSGLGQQT